MVFAGPGEQATVTDYNKSCHFWLPAASGSSPAVSCSLATAKADDNKSSSAKKVCKLPLQSFKVSTFKLAVLTFRNPLKPDGQKTVEIFKWQFA